MRAASLTVLACVLATPSIGAAERTVGSAAVVPFDLGPGRSLVVAVSINGTGPFRFLLDTGANRSAVSEAVAASVNAPVVAQSSVVTAAAEELARVVRLRRLTVGSLSRDGVLAVTLPAPVLSRVVPHLDGIIGQDVLLGLDYTLDYQHQRLTWIDPDVAVTDSLKLGKTSDSLKLVVDEGRYLVELPQNHDGCQSLKLVPDSGASAIVLYRPVDTGLGMQATGIVAGADWLIGHRDARVMRLPELRIGGLTLRDQLVLVVDRPAATTTADGVLPLSLFSRVRFNSQHPSLVVN